VIPINGFTGGVLLVYEAAEVIVESSDSEGIYEPYKSSSIRIQGAIQHPTHLVESMAMASVQMPVPTYQPLLLANLVQQGILSHSQMLAAHWYFDPETKRIQHFPFL
jgi:P-loop containing NTP hydrolase pore-1